jgi:microcystin-dependent protein
MGQPYIGEIRIFAGNFAPVYWATCDGQIVPIAQNDTLFNLIGTTYGGDGQTTFAYPNLIGRVPIHMGMGRSGTAYALGQSGGVSQVALTSPQIPSHTHPIVADNNVANTTLTNPTNAFYGTTAGTTVYSTSTTSLHPMMTLNSSGGSQPHDNMQPFLALTYIISLFGLFPSPT